MNLKIYDSFQQVEKSDIQFLIESSLNSNYDYISFDGECLLQYVNNNKTVFLHLYRSDKGLIPYYEISEYIGKECGDYIDSSYCLNDAIEKFLKYCNLTKGDLQYV